MADKKAAAPKNKAVRDSEGLPVATVRDETEDDKSLNEDAKEAFQEELERGISEDAAKQAAERKSFEDYNAYISSSDKATKTFEEFVKDRDKAAKK